jgi:hypothetical protein
MYPGGRDVDRPQTLAPRSRETPREVILSLREASEKLRSSWRRVSQPVWSTTLLRPITARGCSHNGWCCALQKLKCTEQTLVDSTANTTFNGRRPLWITCFRCGSPGSFGPENAPTPIYQSAGSGSFELRHATGSPRVRLEIGESRCSSTMTSTDRPPPRSLKAKIGCFLPYFLVATELKLTL